MCLQDGIERIVEARQRHQDRYRQDRARHGIAQPRQPHADDHRSARAAAVPHRPARAQTTSATPAASPAALKLFPTSTSVAAERAEVGVLPRQPQQDRRPAAGTPARTGIRQTTVALHPLRARQTARRRAGCARAVKARASSRCALQPQHQHHDAEQHERELGRGRAVAEAEPGFEHAGGQRLHGEVRHHSVVGQRLHPQPAPPRPRAPAGSAAKPRAGMPASRSGRPAALHA